MIKAVRCDQKSFRPVQFKAGFNVIRAKRTKKSTQKDSRNGLGKTLLIEIIHFCLGASTRKNEGLRVKELENWTFALDLYIKGKDYTIYRNTLDFSKVKIEGDVSKWPIKPTFDQDEQKYILDVKDWNVLLGYLMFGIPPGETQKKYSPTFRSLISYFMRRGFIAFADPFKHYPQQKEWDKQVNNAYLLGLNWEYASEFQILKDNERTLNELKKAASQGLLTGYMGSMGESEAERIRLEDEIDQSEQQLKTFKVHPQYSKIQEQANRLTKEIHDIVNQCTINKRILDKYRDSIVQEKDVSATKVREVYEESGFVFPGSLVKKLEQVSNFHKEIIKNRKEFLKTEIDRLSREIETQEANVQRLSNRRAELMAILKTHGALEEYTGLQKRVLEQKEKLVEIRNRIENLKRFEEGKSSLKIAKEELFQNIRRDYKERLPHIGNAIKLFNRYSESLYSEPGILSIDVTETGYKFKVEIKRAGSQGIKNMKVFCYDLTLVRLLSGSGNEPEFLIHDSTIFDGVDERQVARALELASAESREDGFQYICALNTDNVPYDDFSETFKNIFDKHITITFTDATDDGGLLGIRY
jgi:uncharacterized protein YydD (DUF2326 family)